MKTQPTLGFNHYARQRACTSKVTYAAKRDVPSDLEPYRCPFCDQWHGARRHKPVMHQFRRTR